MTKKRFTVLAALMLAVLLLCSCSSADLLQGYRYKISEKTLDLKIGDGYSLGIVGVSRADAAALNIEWSSSDAKVATVDDTGFVVANSEGKADITAHVTSAENASEKVDVKYTCRVNVAKNGVSLEKFGYASSEIELVKGQTFSPRITVYPGNADNRSYTVTSSDESVVKVEADGRIKGVAEGKATITARTDDGLFESTASVTVSAEKNLVEKFTLSEDELSMTQGETETLIASVTPSNLGLEITWSSSDPSVASVSSKGTVTAKRAGKATITATVHDILSDKTATCEVTVTDKDNEIKATSIKLQSNAMTIINGDSKVYNFGASVYPSDSTNVISWSSSNPSLIYVNSRTGDFQLTGTVFEKTVVTLVCRAGALSVKATVTVVPYEEELPKITVTPIADQAWTKDNPVKLTLEFSPEISTAEKQSLSVSFEESDYFDISAQSIDSYTIIPREEGAGTLRFTVSSSSGRYEYVSMSLPFTIGSQQSENDIEVSVTNPVILEAGSTDSDWISVKKNGKPVSPDQYLTFKSANESVVSVNGSGKLTANGVGSTTVNVKSSDGKIDKTVTVYVYSVSVSAGNSSVSVSASGAEITSVNVSVDNADIEIVRDSAASSSVTDRLVRKEGSSLLLPAEVSVSVEIKVLAGGKTHTVTKTLTVTVTE